MAGIKFDFTIGDENIKQKMAEIRQSVSQTAKVMEHLSKFGFDVDTAEHRVESLKRIISDLETNVGERMKRIDEYGRQAQQALNNGDYSTFDVITKDIEQQIVAVKKLDSEIGLYKETLDQIQNTDLNNLSNQLNKQDETISDINQKGNKYRDIIDSLPAPLKNAVNGFLNLVKAAKAFLATPIGAVIGTVTLAFSSLMTYLNGSAEGQMKLAKATGYFKGVMMQLKEDAIQLGKKISDAFEDPQGAVDKLGEKIKNNLQNRWEAIKGLFSKNSFGDMLYNAMHGNWEGVKDAAKELGDDFLGLTVGIENGTDKIAEKAEEIDELAKQMADLSERQRKNDIERYDVEKKTAVLDEKIAENREKMYSTETSIAEKRQAVRDSEDAIKQKYDEQIRLAEEDLAIAQEIASLRTNDQETLNDIKEKETAVVRLQAQRQQELASLARRSATFARQELQEAQELIELKRQTKEEELSMAKDSYDKRMKMADLAYQKEVDEINKKKEDMLLKGGGQLTFEQMMALGEAMRIATQKYEKAQKEAGEAEDDAMNEYLIKWGTTEEKRLAIKKKYEKLIAEAGTEGEKKALEKDMTQALYNIDIKAKDSSLLIVKLFGDMRKKTVKELRYLSKEGTKLLEFIKKGTYNEEEGKLFGITQETFDMLKASPEMLESIANAVEKITTQAEKMESPFMAVFDAMKELFASDGDTNKITTSINTMTSAMTKLQNGATLVSDAINMISVVSNNSNLKDSAKTLTDTLDVVQGTLSGAGTGASIGGGWGAIIGAALGFGTSLGSKIIENADSSLTNYQDRLNDQIRLTVKEYSRLEEAVSKAYSSDKAKVIEQESKALETQRDLVQKQLDAERQKKYTDKSAVQAYEDALDDLNKKIEQTKEAEIDAIVGSDVMSAINSFADAYINAWSAGESKANSVKDMVRNMMRQTVTEAVKAAVASSQKMQEIRENLVKYMKDGQLQVWERKSLEQAAEDLQRDLDEQFGWADDIMRNNGTLGGYNSKSVSTMTQATGEALEGRFTAFQTSNDLIAARMQESINSMALMLNVLTENNGVLDDILEQNALSNVHLSDIVKYSKAISQWGENVQRIASNTERI